MRLVVYIVDVLVVSASAWMLVWVCRVRGWVPRAVAFFVGLYAIADRITPPGWGRWGCCRCRA